MKKSEFIDKVLIHPQNTVFVNKHQVAAILEVFESLGMKPPETKEFIEIPDYNILGAGFKLSHTVNKWDSEDESK